MVTVTRCCGMPQRKVTRSVGVPGARLPCNTTICDRPAPNVPPPGLTETLPSLVPPIQSSGCPPMLVSVIGGQRPAAQFAVAAGGITWSWVGTGTVGTGVAVGSGGIGVAVGAG